MLKTIGSITTNEIWQQGFLHARKTNKTGIITPVTLANEASIASLNLRDQWLAIEAERVWNRLGDKLFKLWPLIINRIWVADQSYAQDIDDQDIAGEYGPQIAGYSLAVLHWYKLVKAGKVEHLMFFPVEDAQQWLAENQPIQAQPVKQVKPVKAKKTGKPVRSIQLVKTAQLQRPQPARVVRLVNVVKIKH